MAVKTTPIQHQEVDYAEMCVRLQEKIGTMEKELSTRLQEQQAKYETIMQVLQQEVRCILSMISIHGIRNSYQPYGDHPYVACSSSILKLRIKQRIRSLIWQHRCLRRCLCKS